MIGGAAFVLGGTLLGVAVVAGAAGPTISTPYLTGPIPVTGGPAIVVGSGFVPKSYVWLTECNVVTSGTAEPTVQATIYPNPNSTKTALLTLPVGCSVPSRTATEVSAKGDLPVTAFGVVAGTVGPPAPGNDSSGASGTTDAANYPCPPYVSQAGTNACQIEAVEADGTTASVLITFAGTNSTPNPTATTTTTTAPCNAINGQITAPVTGAFATTGTGTATVDQPGGAAPSGNPSAVTCVLGGETVQVAASGLSVGTVAGGLYTLIECSNVPGQPTIDYVGHPVPVSCSAIGKTSLFPLSTNSFPNTPFTIIQGFPGPPVVGTDSSGGSSVADAQNYPCPPSAAQVAADPDASCVIAVGTAYLSGTPTNTDQLPVPITFNENKLSQGTTSNNATSAAAAAAAAAAAKTAAKTSATKASSSSLAFTGAGPGLRLLGLLGVLLMLLGAMALVVVDAPRRFLRLAVVRGRRGRGEETDH